MGQVDSIFAPPGSDFWRYKILTKLQTAISKSKVERVTKIIQQYPDVLDLRFEHTFLHWASIEPSATEILQLILRKQGDKYLTLESTADDLTPLHGAIQILNVGGMEILLHALWETNRIQNETWDKHILSFLFSRTPVGVIEYLLPWIQQSKFRSHILNRQDEFGRTPLHLAVNSTASRPQIRRLFRLLIQAGADTFHQRDMGNQTPIERILQRDSSYHFLAEMMVACGKIESDIHPKLNNDSIQNYRFEVYFAESLTTRLVPYCIYPMVWI